MKKTSSFCVILALLAASMLIGLSGCPTVNDDPPGGDPETPNTPETPNPPPFLLLAPGFLVKQDGTLWAAGNNTRGGLGVDKTIKLTKYTQMKDVNGTPITNVKQVAVGVGTIILKNDGTLLGSGRNNYGFLGLGDLYSGLNDNLQRFTPLTTDGSIGGPPITGVTLIGNGGCIIVKDGEFWVVGTNIAGQLGIDAYALPEAKTVFTKIDLIDSTGSPISGASVDAIYTLGTVTFLLKGGEVWAAGSNTYGGLGLGDKTDRNRFTKVPGLSNVVKLVSAGFGTIALKSDGTLWVSGKSSWIGDLGMGTLEFTSFTQVTTDGTIGGTPITGVKDISYNILLKTDGTVMVTQNPKTMGLKNLNENPTANLYHPFYKQGQDLWGTPLTGVRAIGDGGIGLFLLNNGTLLASGSGSASLGLGLATYPANVPLDLDDNSNHVQFDE